MFAFPISTDTSVRRKPWANYVLIGLNVFIFLVPLLQSGTLHESASPVGEWLAHFGALNGTAPQVYQFITYQFLHGGWGHIFGNMLFLWIFGNPVNAKMGNASYVLFYLAGGVFAAAGYLWFLDHSLVGASGSIAAITTAYLVLFPRSNVRIFYWFYFFIGTFEIPSMWLIVFKLILWDNLIFPKMSGQATNVAFDAHLAGYAFGFVATCVMLALHLLPRDQFDIVALWRRRWQRQSFRSAMSTPEAQTRAQYGRVARPVTVDDVRTVDTPAGPTDPVSQLRLQIAESLARKDRDTAAGLYEQLLGIDPRQVLSRQQQLDVANQLYTLHRLPQAAAAYEKLLANYGQVAGDEATHVRLLLGIIYARDLQQYEVAEGHLLACLGKLTDDRRRQQCVHWLNVSAAALGHPMPEAGGQGGSGSGERIQN